MGLPALFGRIVIPSVVRDELAHREAPEAVAVGWKGRLLGSKSTRISMARCIQNWMISTKESERL